MKALCLAISLLAITSPICAAPCTPKSARPCTPVEGDETNDAYAKILANIADAEKAEPVVQKKLAAYVAVRDNMNVTAEDRMATFNEYRYAKIDQDLLYQNAIEGTADLYHVRPKHTDMITIGEPDESDMKYMAGLTATWRPEVTDSGPGVKLAVRIKDADGQFHYSGAMNLNPLETDPDKPKQRMAFTLSDGRVFILKDTFKIAVDKENLGYLASVIYHESRHFDRLSWKDNSGKNRSWAAMDKEERDAYKAEKRIAKDVFGLEQDDIDFLEAQYQAYANAVETGVPITDDDMTPLQLDTWKNHYEHKQVNIDEEYWKLYGAVTIERATQLDAQKREREERTRRAEEARLEKERAGHAAREEFAAEAGRCGYRLDIKSYDDDTVIGFKGLKSLHYFESEGIPSFKSVDIQIIFLLTRTCDSIKNNYVQDDCNGSAPAIRERASSGELRAQVANMLTFKTGSDAKACVDYILDNAGSITDYKSLGKVTVKYQKHMAEEQREYDKIWHSAPPLSTPPEGGRPRPPADDNRGCFRNGDPFGCQPR